MGTQLTTAAATAAVVKGVASATKAIAAVNGKLSASDAQLKLQEFVKQSALLDHAGESMGDVMDGLMDGDEEAEADEHVQQVLDEIGVGDAVALAGIKATPKAAAVAEPEGPTEEHDDLQSRLRALRAA